MSHQFIRRLLPVAAGLWLVASPGALAQTTPVADPTIVAVARATATPTATIFATDARGTFQADAATSPRLAGPIQQQFANTLWVFLNTNLVIVFQNNVPTLIAPAFPTADGRGFVIASSQPGTGVIRTLNGVVRRPAAGTTTTAQTAGSAELFLNTVGADGSVVTSFVEIALTFSAPPATGADGAGGTNGGTGNA